jgi:ribokinase
VRPLSVSTLQAADVLTPNEVEAKVLAGLNPDAAIAPEDVGRKLVRRGVKQVVMTLGENGALIVTAFSCRHVPAVAMKAVDTTGAGDAFNAGLATALAYGAKLEDAVQFATVTGGLAVTREGVIPALPRRSEVVECYRKRNLIPPDWLVVDVAPGA